MKLKAKRNFKIGGTEYTAGDILSTSPNQSVYLIWKGLADKVDPETEKRSDKIDPDIKDRKTK